jgi:predicted ATPase
MIRRLFIDNYKCLVNFELKLERLTLLIGPNGAGKSAVLDVLFALRQLLAGMGKVTDASILPASTLTRWQRSSTQAFEVDAELDGKRLCYRLEVEHDRSQRRARIMLERLDAEGQPLFEFRAGEVQLYRDDHSQGPRFSADWTESALARVPPRPDNTQLTRFLEFLRKVMVCRRNPASFRAESASEDVVLERDGSNFAGWYRHLLLERQDLVPPFTEALQDVLKGFRGIRLEKVGLDTRALMVRFEHQNQEYELRLDELSDGQRALVALYALVHLTAGQGYTLVLDEPDNYLALPEIQPWLMELNDACGKTLCQAVLCSHHPELIDYLGPDRGVLLERERSGAVRSRSVVEAFTDDRLKLSEQVARGWQS